MVEDLDRTRRHLAARRVRIPAAPDVDARRVRDLPGDLKPGELRIEFCGAEHLAAKLFELSQSRRTEPVLITDYRAEPNNGVEYTLQ